MELASCHLWAPRILVWLLDFWKTCLSLVISIYYTLYSVSYEKLDSSVCLSRKTDRQTDRKNIYQAIIVNNVHQRVLEIRKCL